MRHLTLIVLLSLLAAGAAEAQLVGHRADDAEFYEIKAGNRWKVFSSRDPDALGVSGAPVLKASLDDPATNTFVVFPALAVDELEDEDVLPSVEAESIRQDLADEGLDYRDVADIFVVHLEAADPSSEGPAVKGLFDSGWQDPKTLNEHWNPTEPGNPESCLVTEASFDGDVTVTLPMTADIDATVTYQIKKKFGIPYKFRFLEAVFVGEAAIQGDLVVDAEFSYTVGWHWKKRILEIHLGTISFWVGPIPVFLKFNLPVDVGLDASVKVAGSAEVRTSLDGTAHFDVVCTSSSCEGDTTFDESFDMLDPSYELTLDANARIWARVAVEMEIYDESLGLAWLGVTGYVQAHLFGYLGNQCGDLDGDGSQDTLEDLLLDLDAGYSVDAGLSGHLLPNKEWTLLEDLWHVRLWDLWEDSEGWNLADPLITGPTTLDVGEMAMYEFRTRPCYPYPDDLYLQWTGPVTGSGWLTPRTGLLTDSEWPVGGVHTLTVTAVDDVHGRELGVSTSMEVTVIDPDPPVELVNDVVLGDLSAPVDDESFFALNVPEGAADLTFTLSGGSGNADLYVRLDERPTTQTFLCRSENGDNNESCSIPVPDAGRYYVLLYGSGAYSGASLVASFTEPVTHDLFVDVPVVLTGAAGSKTFYALEVPAGASDLAFTLSGGTGDADLYVRFGTWPGLTAFDCRSREADNEEICQVPLPRGGTHYVMVYGFDPYSEVTLLATYNEPGGELTNGVALTELSGDAGSRTFYTIDVPPGADDLTVTLSGGTGDADLYVRFGVLPSTLLYDCSSWNIGNDDSCVFPSPEPGRYHVLVYGHTPYSGVSLVASYTEAVELVNGVALNDLSGTHMEEMFFTIEVPEEATNLTFTLSADTGDPDLYVRFGAQPDRDTFEWDCASQDPEPNVDSCSFPSPQAGRYHVLVYAFSDYSGATLVASYAEPPSDGELVNGARVNELAGADDSELFFTIDVPADATDLRVELLGGSGDADLYVRFGLQPSTSTYDCRSWADGNSDSCSFAEPEVGTWHILVHGYSTYSGVSLTASYTQPAGSGGELANRAPETNLSGDEDHEVFYTFEVPAGAADLTFTLSGGAGDADLYVRFGAQPSTSAYDCQAVEIGNTDSCSFAVPQAGTWHVLVQAYSDFSGADLSASFVENGVIFSDGFESGDTSGWSGHQ